MLASQRYPHDYDGIVAAAPDPYWITRDAYSLQLQQAMYPDPDQRATPVVSAENRTSLERRILAACDRLDGVEDGVLTDPRQCSFDPASLPHCSAGSAAECLTEDQLRVVKAVYGGLVLDNEQVFAGLLIRRRKTIRTAGIFRSASRASGTSCSMILVSDMRTTTS